MQPDISLVIPVYNENDSLPVLHGKIQQVMREQGWSYEVVYVDDGSRDGSIETLRRLQADDPAVVLAIQRRNFGKSQALMTGFALAKADLIATLDSDLQDEPAELPRLREKLEEGYDIVSGWKKERKDPLSKRIPSKIANSVTGMTTGLRLHDMNSGLKLYRAQCAHTLHIYGDMHRYIPILAHLNGFRVTEIPVVHHERQFGLSKYGPGRLIRGGLDLITVLFLTRYGRRPLHVIGLAGGIMLMIGFFINLVLTLEWLGGTRGLSNRPLLLLGILLMLVGVQLLSTGLLGELLVAFIERSRDPLETVRRVHRSAEAADPRITPERTFNP